MSEPIAVIAGAGHFPVYVAQEALRQGHAVVGIGIHGWADPALARVVSSYEEVAVGQLARLIERLKAWHVRQAIMAGQVTKAVLLDPRNVFDAEALAVLRGVGDFSVGSVLGAIGARLAREGVTLLDSSTFLQRHLSPVGPLTARAPTPLEQDDIQLGVQVARALAALDVGQTVVVKQRVVIAVEALEGTDATIRRAHTLAHDGLVVVKTASPGHDRRFDLPVIGQETMATLITSGVSCLAMEAGTTLLLEKDAIIAAANASHLCLIGITAP